MPFRGPIRGRGRGSLLAIRVRDLTTLEPLENALPGLLVELEPYPCDFRDELAGEIVGGGAQAACDHDEVGLARRPVELSAEERDRVGHLDASQHREAQGRQLR